MVSPMTQPGKARAAEAAHSPSNIPSVPSVVYVASPRSSPRAAAPWWWGRSAVSVRPCVRVSVRPRVRPASLPVSPVRPVLLLKTTCEKKNYKKGYKTLDRKSYRAYFSNIHAVTTLRASAIASKRSHSAGSVTFSPNEFNLPVPW